MVVYTLEELREILTEFGNKINFGIIDNDLSLAYIHGKMDAIEDLMENVPLRVKPKKGGYI